MDAMTQLASHVRYRIGSRATHCGAARCDELTRLVVMHWPHRHLEAAASDGRASKAIDHAMTLLRAQVREQWEARHGIGPIWPILLAGTVASISQVLLDLWFSDRQWALRLEELGRQLRTGGR